MFRDPSPHNLLVCSSSSAVKALSRPLAMGCASNPESVVVQAARNVHAPESSIWTRRTWGERGLATQVAAAWATTHPPEMGTLFYNTFFKTRYSKMVLLGKDRCVL
jgi:hypothetical protein